MWYSVVFIETTERSVSLILVILGTLVHFRHYSLSPIQIAVIRGRIKNQFDNVALVTNIF
ncbi:hypothetical protein D1AOALGA4SA_12289 [Olavius algarvensis Delta 1 endosymbiont]|nr:hypothetical protein D1AOALGA4SA_12289 [Olavius algarvensis Delta 1 endosymbiont]